MGSECLVRTTPLHKQRMSQVESSLRSIKDELQFSIKVSQLRLIHFSKRIQCIKFTLPRLTQLNIPLNDLHVEQHLMRSTKQYSDRFKVKGKDIHSNTMHISIQDSQGHTLEQLHLKLHHLCTGPSHHDHLLKELRSRFSFNLEIEQILYLRIHVHSAMTNAVPRLEKCALDMPIFRNHPPRISQIAREIKGISLTDALPIILQIQWYSSSLPKTEGKSVQGQVEETKAILFISMGNSEIKTSTIHIAIHPPGSNSPIRNYYVPYSRFTDSPYQLEIMDGVQFQRRRTMIEDESGVELHILSSRLYVQQMECMVLSEKGVVTVNAPQGEADSGSVESVLKKIRRTNEEQINKVLKESTEQLKVKISYSGEGELLRLQHSLVNIATETSNFLKEDDSVRNECVWGLLDVVLHKEQLELRYLNSLESEIEKKKICVAYYEFILGVLVKVICSTRNAITYMELCCIQKFISFTYFRLPWCQEAILKVLVRQTDPPITHQKLSDLGASLACHSPSKSTVFDWARIYEIVKGEERIKSAMNQVFKESANGQWAELLFSREEEDLFYGIYLSLWEEADKVLKHGREIKWEYFPQYGRLLSIFLGEMNNNRIDHYSDYFRKCSLKLISNEKLLNTFITLLYPKTCLYETHCVLKCLNLLHGYFQAIVEKRNHLPNDFHFDYFYSGIRSILQSNHSYLLAKTLQILYKFFHLFTNHDQITLHHFLIKIFHNLFLHWSQNVRRIFHYLVSRKLIDKIKGTYPSSTLQTMGCIPHQINMSASSHLGRVNTERNLEDIQLENELKHISYSQTYESLIQDLYCFKEANCTPITRPTNISYHQSMRANLTARRRPAPLLLQIEEDLQDVSRKVSMNELNSLKTKLPRKWSERRQGFEDVPKQGWKYVSVALQEYQESKKDTNPNGKVDTIAQLYSPE